MYNIVLCGFMGCGKTTVGKILAEKLSMKFIDMDDEIVRRENMSINEIFRLRGEDYFRDCEHMLCRDLSDTEGLVIATGGGALTFQRNTDVFKNRDLIFFLDVPVDEIKRRLENDDTRPLLSGEDRDRKMKDLFEKRYDIYRNASDFSVKGVHTPDESADLITEIYKNNK